MRTLVVTPPAPVLTPADARAHLSDVPDADEFLANLIAAATASIDGPDKYLGRALGVQTLEARVDGFDLFAPLVLPCPPLISIESVTYLDGAGVLQTITANGYEAFGNQVDPVFGSSWPSARWGRETVRIRYKAGYVVDPTADPLVPALPFDIRAALLLMVGDLYSNRETTVDARAAAAVPIPMSTTVETLLGPYRIWR